MKCGETFTGNIHLDGDSGSAALPIVIASYDAGAAPIIDAAGYVAGVYLEGSSHIEVRDLELVADGGVTVDGSDATLRSGVYVKVLWGNPVDGITLNNLNIHDIYPELDVASEGCNPTTYKGYGVHLAGTGNATSNYPVQNVLIEDCTISEIGYTAIFASRVDVIDLNNNQIIDVGGPGIQPSRCTDLNVIGNLTDGTGSYLDPRMHGRGSGIWPWTCERVLIEGNTFMNAVGREDSCGVHIDFGNKDVVVQYNLSVNNAGGFIEILGNNYNSAYRYNVSINDGWREEGIIDQGTIANNSEGRLVFVSGFVGAKDGVPNDYSGPFDTYIYNNTMYVKAGQTSHFTIHGSALGLLISNNIFYIDGPVANVIRGWKVNGSWTTNYGQSMIDSVVWENNVYENADSIPVHLPFGDTSPIIGDPSFVNKGGLLAEDYVTANNSLVVDQSVAINALPGDPLGLLIGLSVTDDFFGNSIINQAEIGAIELVLGSAPTWSADPFNQTSATEDVSYTSYLSWRVSDAEGDALSFSKVSGPAWATISNTGKISGTPTQVDVGAGVFVVSVSDGINSAVEATMNLTVAGVNDAPVFTNTSFAASNAEVDFAYADSILGTAFDVDGDVITYGLVSGPAWLSVASDGSLSGTPVASDVGLNSFTVSASDGTVSVNAVLNITVALAVNNPPVWSGDPVWIAGGTEDVAYSASLTWAASDTEGDALTYAKVSGDSWVSVSANGIVTGNPGASEVGTATLLVSASDGVNAAVTTTIKLNVTAVNDAPIWSADSINASNATEGSAYAGSLSGLATDEEGAVAYAKVYGPTWLSVASDGTLSGTPGAGDVGANSFSVSASDGSFAVNATLNITVDALPTPTEILYDDFEAGMGNWTDGGSDCILYTGGSYAVQGSNAVNLRDNTNTSVATTADLALSAYSEIIVEFAYQVINFNANEDFWLQISTDGGVSYTTVQAWTVGTDFNNGEIKYESVSITGATLTDQTRIRFRCDASGNGDDVYLDEVRVSVQ